ncbi:hypothetical protein GGH95_003638, partial [Coemansia sp. RSA 1836]
MRPSSFFNALCFGAVLASAQFAFTVDNTDADAIYSDIQAMWPDWAAAGNQVLGSAKDEYLDAWLQLAALYGSTSLPVLFNAGLARAAAGALANAQAETTVWDKDAGEHAQYTFGIREVSIQGTPTAHTSVSSLQTGTTTAQSPFSTVLPGTSMPIGNNPSDSSDSSDSIESLQTIS